MTTLTRTLTLALILVLVVTQLVVWELGLRSGLGLSQCGSWPKQPRPTHPVAFELGLRLALYETIIETFPLVPSSIPCSRDQLRLALYM